MASNVIREKWFAWGWKGPKGTPYSVEQTQTQTKTTATKTTKKAPPKE